MYVFSEEIYYLKTHEKPESDKYSSSTSASGLLAFPPWRRMNGLMVGRGVGGGEGEESKGGKKRRVLRRRGGGGCGGGGDLSLANGAALVLGKPGREAIFVVHVAARGEALHALSHVKLHATHGALLLLLASYRRAPPLVVDATEELTSDWFF